MAAPSKLWTAIADARIDGDSPLVEKLFADLRDNDEHLRQWLGGNFTPEVDHNHDGINSAPVGNSEWQSLDISDHFFAAATLAESNDAFQNRWREYSNLPNKSQLVAPTNAVALRGHDVVYFSSNGIMSSQRIPLKVRSYRVVMRVAFPAWSAAASLRMGIEDPANVVTGNAYNCATIHRGTQSNTIKFRTAENNQVTVTDNLGVAENVVWNNGGWNEFVIENWIDTDLAPDGQKESILYVNGVAVATHNTQQGAYVPGANNDVLASIVLVCNDAWVDMVRVTTPPTKKLNTFPLPTQ